MDAKEHPRRMVAFVGGDRFRGVIDDVNKKCLTTRRRGALVRSVFSENLLRLADCIHFFE